MSGSAGYSFISPCFPLVMAQQPAQQRVPMDMPDLSDRRREVGRVNRIIAYSHRPAVFDVIWTETIVVVHIRSRDVILVAEAEAEEVVQTLTLKHADPRFGEAISDRSLERRPDDLFAHASEVFVEGFSVLRIAVVDQEAKHQVCILQPHLKLI